jgi:SAM-dependent methyltransferase
VKYRLLSWLCCPGCRSEDLRLETFSARTTLVTRGHFEQQENPPGVDLERGEEQEVIEGALHCGGCVEVFPIRGGIPRMMLSDSVAGPPSRHNETPLDVGRPEWEQNFQDLAKPLAPEDFLGKLVLDAGCGFGRHTFFAARYGAEVVGMDSSASGVEAAHRNTSHLVRAHVVQADVYRPPFRDATFDLAYSFGVLHHLDRPLEAFKVLGEMVRPGGRLSLWVYGPRQGASLTVNKLLRGVTTEMTPEDLEGLSRGIARGLRLFSHTPYRLLRHIPVAHSVVSHLPIHDHHQWPFDVVVADIYDRLRTPVHHWFKGEELEQLFTDDGYADVLVTRRVRNNETFRATGIRR